MTDKPTKSIRPGERLTKVVFAGFALASVLAGLGIYIFSEVLDIDEDTAQVVSTGFLVVGIIDTVVLYLWNRIFRRRS
jgi:hypothetical protein